MAPALPPRSVSSSSSHIRAISRSVSASIASSSSTKETVSLSKTPLASFVALILRETIQFTKQTLLSSPKRRDLVEPVFLEPRSLPPVDTISKRQTTAILAIPTTYAGLNSGPAPGALVGIVLGSIAGFLLILYVVLSLFRFTGFYGNREVVEEKVVRHSHRRRPSRSASRTSRSVSRVRSAATSVRRERVHEEDHVIVEEHIDPPSVVEVLEEEDDIVEVIEEHSPERSPPRRKPSGYRTVDPAEFAGGRRGLRGVGRR